MLFSIYTLGASRMNTRKSVVALLSILFILTLSQSPAFAVASLSRMYDLGCTACHSATPRVNYFGEKLMLRGYELDRMTPADLPADHLSIESGTMCTSCHNSGVQGAEVTAKEISPDMVLHQVSNYMSVRLKFTALELKTNDQPDQSGDTKTRVTLGKGNWAQFWVAGPIAKNIALRLEAELSDKSEVGMHNYAVIMSNLFHTDGTFNMRFGGFTHGEWTSISDQKRTFAPHFDIYNVTSAGGSGVDTFKVAGAEPGVEFYGFSGPVVYQAGISSGKGTSDPNKFKNYWGTLKWYFATDGAWAGSNVSAQYISGTDTSADLSQEDSFDRYIVNTGIRRADMDLAAVYVHGEDDNWDLATSLKNEFDGGFVQLLYHVAPKFWLGTIYNLVDSDDESINKEGLLVGFNYYMRQNHFWSVYYNADLTSESIWHPEKKSSLVVQFRSNF